MFIHRLHTISGLLTVACFISKLVMHFYLDYRQYKQVGLARILLTPLPFLLPYQPGTEGTLRPLERLCNLMLILSCLFLGMNLICGIIIFREGHT